MTVKNNILIKKKNIGKLSQHSHKVFGANNFGIGAKNASAIQYFDYVS